MVVVVGDSRLRVGRSRIITLRKSMLPVPVPALLNCLLHL